jgi:asparagine synthase (glutamine-hydrolysing)
LLVGVAEQTARHYGFSHQKVNFTSDDAARLCEKTIYHTELPLINPHSMAKYRLSEFAREKNFVVALTGEGSDELLLGYSPFRLDVLLEMRNGGQVEKVERLMEEFKKKEVNGSPTLLGTLPEPTPM